MAERNFVCVFIAGPFTRICASQDPVIYKNRLDDMSPFPVAMPIDEEYPDWEQALEAEKEMHAKYAAYRIRGKWYSNEALAGLLAPGDIRAYRRMGCAEILANYKYEER